MSNKKVIIVGAGFGGLSLAAMLSKKGFDVSVYEKNEQIGGRARVIKEKGYTFDMGPSWYMMPDVFENFFNILGENISDYISLKRLSPSYRVYFKGNKKPYDFYSDREKNTKIFEEIEPGSSKKLFEYLDESKRQYQIAKREFMYKNYDSIFDFFNKRVMKEGRRLEIFNSMKRIIERTVKSEVLRKVLQFHMVFLGTAPQDAPGIYRLMNHVDFDLGVWYPDKGIYELPKAIAKVAEKYGAKIHLNSPVRKIIVENKKATGIELDSGEKVYADIVVSNADLHHTEEKLLGEEFRERSEKFWSKKKMAPSAFIMYLGVNKKFDSLAHHTLLFSKDWDLNFAQIFDKAKFPDDPSIYVCAPGKTDPSVAPDACENLFILIPVAAGLKDNDEIIQHYFELVMKRLEQFVNENITDHLLHKRNYSVSDFTTDYNAYKGNAYGLANTLMQTAMFKPKIRSKKLSNLFFAGQLTVPGPGVPPSIISGKVAANQVVKEFKLD